MLPKQAPLLRQTALHWVGNPHREEEMQLSKHLGRDPASLQVPLWRVARKIFRQPRFFRFKGASAEERKAPFQHCREIFNEPAQFLSLSQDLARNLHSSFRLPQAKGGEFLLAHFTGLPWEEWRGEALLLLKVDEQKEVFFTEASNEGLDLHAFDALDLSKVNRAALLLNKNVEDGYQVLLAGAGEEQNGGSYWRDDFLGLEPRAEAYNQTEEVIALTKNFVEQSWQDADAPLSRPEALATLERSAAFFQEEEEFEAERYQSRVFEDPAVAERFQAYVEQRESALPADSFAISGEAVKKQQRFFRSVIKLDKNFHLYVHGDRSRIERGEEADGRKYYKLYFDEES